jgi:hypothetical protein
LSGEHLGELVTELAPQWKTPEATSRPLLDARGYRPASLPYVPAAVLLDHEYVFALRCTRALPKGDTMTTAVIGATGRVGSEIVHGLLAHGDAVAALVRDPGKARRATRPRPGCACSPTRRYGARTTT